MNRTEIKMNKLIKQILRFGVVGGSAFLIDFGVLWIFADLLGVHYLISNVIAFTVSVIYNYILSILWVFDTDKTRSKTAEMAIFVLLSVIGLGINELIMWICVDGMQIAHLISKIAATAIVMVYNFITRKLFLEKGEK